MSNSKLEIKIGNLEFSAEGSEKWVSNQLDKVIEKLPTLMEHSEELDDSTGSADSSSDNQAPKKKGKRPQNLASYLKENDATSNQTKKFLATAVFLQQNGKERLGTGDIAKALRDSKQQKLTNASQMLSNNITKGFCEKVGKEFFVTDLGEQQMK